MKTTRRHLLQSCAAGAAAITLPAVVSGRNLNDRLQVACVGVDGIAGLDMGRIGSHPSVRFVGFCDVDANRFAKADAKFAGVRHFRDYREMFATLADTIDAVIVDTPDHMHAPVAVAALQRRWHVYCQKPISHTAWEARQMRLWAESSGVATQMGNQLHSSAEYRLATRLVKEGAIGGVKEVYSWAGVTGNDWTRLLAPPQSAAVPPHLDWNLWIGAAPMRGYSPAYHPFTWRDWQDFGAGALGDFGCHILDPVFTALELTAPRTVQAKNSGINDQIWPTQQTVTYTFPGTDFTADDTLKVTWMDGGLRPSHSLARMPGDVDLPAAGSLFIGEKGCMVLPHFGMPKLYPVEQYADFPLPKEVARDHWHDWVQACLTGGRTTAGFHYAGPVTEAVHLGNIATRLARPKIEAGTAGTGRLAEPAQILEWDSKAFRFSQAEADRLLTKTYRTGFEVPAAPAG